MSLARAGVNRRRVRYSPAKVYRLVASLPHTLPVWQRGTKSVVGRDGVLHALEGGGGTGVDAFAEGEVDGRGVPQEDEVEELGQGTVALGPHLLDGRHDLVHELVGHLEAALDLGVLVVVPERDQRHRLTGDVTV